MEKKKKKGKSFIERYNEKEAKGNTKNTFVKGGVDAVASSVLGTGLGAVSGKYSAITGIALIFVAHYYGDETGVLRVIGSSAIGYGIAKAKDYQENPEYNSVQKRVKGLGNDLFASLHVKWKQEQKSTSKEPKPIIKKESDLDKLTNGLDLAEQIIEERKADYQKKKQELEIEENKEVDPFDDPETDLSLI